MIDLDKKLGGNYIKINGTCKRVNDWSFISKRYCKRGIDCDTTLILFFEDGSKHESDNIENLENC